MARIKRGAGLASTLMLIAVVISACKTPYSTAPAGTPTNANSLFETPIGSTPGMGAVEMFGTQTAIASAGAVSSGTPDVIPTQTPEVAAAGTQDPNATATPTALVSADSASTATLALSGTQSGILPTSAPVGSRPATYTLQPGEFPYCIARRFDVDPDALLSLNGLSNGTIYRPNLSLRIPQSGSFPGTRALRNHPATYTVASAKETIYSVACLFGDVDPAAIAQANNIAAGSALSSGQSLSIP